MPDYLAALLFFLPAGIANMSPVLANYLPVIKSWETPIDFGLKWRGKVILGPNKRWRGLIFGTLMGGLTALVVARFVPNAIVSSNSFAVGCVLGFGALFGDAIESLFKRRLKIKAGDSWFPFDQIDYILGGLLFILPIVAVPLWAILTIFVAYFGLHLLFAYLGYKVGLKPKPI